MASKRRSICRSKSSPATRARRTCASPPRAATSTAPTGAEIRCGAPGRKRSSRKPSSLNGFSHVVGRNRREPDLCFVRLGDELAVLDGLLQSFLQICARSIGVPGERECLGDFARILNAEFDQLLGVRRLRRSIAKGTRRKSGNGFGTVCSTITLPGGAMGLIAAAVALIIPVNGNRAPESSATVKFAKA